MLCRTLRTALHRLRADRSAAVMPIVAIASMSFMVGAALSVDMGNAYLTKQKLQVATDAATLAAAAELPDLAAAAAIARAIIAANLDPAVHGSTLGAGGIEYGVWDEGRREFRPTTDNPTAVRLKVERSVANGNPLPTFFGGIVGGGPTDIVSEAIATQGGYELELAMVLDVSGSMATVRATNSSTPPRPGAKLPRLPSERKIYTLQRVSLDLLDILAARQRLPDHLHVAVLPFSGRVNIKRYAGDWMTGPTGSTTATGTLCSGSRTGVADMDDTPPDSAPFRHFTGNPVSCPEPRALALTADLAEVERSIRDLAAGGSTNTDQGLAWGWRAISPRWRGDWGAAGHPYDYDDQGKRRKAVLIITDGENTPHQTWDSYSTSQADKRLEDACTALKRNGVDILAVNFDAPPSINALYRRCVSNASYWFDAKDAGELEAAFRQVARILGGRGRLVM